MFISFKYCKILDYTPKQKELTVFIMNNSFNKNKITSQLGFALTAAALTGAYAICVAAVMGHSIYAALLCCAVCFAFALTTKGTVYVPYVYMLVPILFIFSSASPIAGHLSVALGGILFLILNRINKSLKIPSPVIAGAALGLALAVTVLLTNDYFGIGAFGSTPLEMLKNYRYLGFHPLFRGLLYGTITLFTMITYPFKFKKLNRYLPAEFITLFVPFVLNLLLNPIKEYTTINEAICFEKATFITEFFGAISHEQIPDIIETAFAIGFLLFIYSSYNNHEKATILGTANSVSGLVSGIAVRPYPIRGYGKLSALLAILIVSVILFFPGVASRIPMHCAGSLLIVSAWQHLPLKAFSETFRNFSIIKLSAFFICAVSFILLDIFAAVIVCLIASLILQKKRGATE